MNKPTKEKEVDILDEELNIETSEEIERIWPENYETYVGDGIYRESVN